jgi:putative hemolysin
MTETQRGWHKHPSFIFRRSSCVSHRDGKALKGLLILAIILGVAFVAACGAQPTAAPTEAPPTAEIAVPTPTTFESPLPTPTQPPDAFESPFESPVGLPNPASKFCQDQGYELEMRTDADGTAGYCLFPDGTECEEWAFFRGECAPGAP